MNKKTILKKKPSQTKINSNPTEEAVLMTVPPTKKRKKVIKIETENTKKEKEEIQKQNELKLQIKEIEEKINFEQNQRNILMSMKKAESIFKQMMQIFPNNQVSLVMGLDVTNEKGEEGNDCKTI